MGATRGATADLPRPRHGRLHAQGNARTTGAGAWQSGRPRDTLAIAEGFESAHAFTILHDIPCWAAQTVLPSKVPDSGTPSALRDGSWLAQAKGYATDAIKSPLYSDRLNETLARLVLDRPDFAIKAGTAIKKRKQLGGMFFAPAALSYSPPSLASRSAPEKRADDEVEREEDQRRPDQPQGAVYQHLCEPEALIGPETCSLRR